MQTPIVDTVLAEDRIEYDVAGNVIDSTRNGLRLIIKGLPWRKRKSMQSGAHP